MGKFLKLQFAWVQGKSLFLDLSMCLSKCPPGGRDSDAYSEMPVYQWYVGNVVPLLLRPRNPAEYPWTHH